MENQFYIANNLLKGQMHVNLQIKYFHYQQKAIKGRKSISFEFYQRTVKE